MTCIHVEDSFLEFKKLKDNKDNQDDTYFK